MSFKVSELPDEKKNSIYGDLKNKAHIIGIDTYENTNVIRCDDNYGLCSSCKQFSVKKAKFSIKNAYCLTDSYVRLSSEDPIIECSEYEKRGSMTLEQMWLVAILIDKPKEKIGLI